MGQVFRARDRASGEPVAVKVISPTGKGTSAQRASRARSSCSPTLSHPGIVRYIAHGPTPAGELFLVMEWLDGEDLKTRLERAPAHACGEAVKLATRVAEALGAAHARGIVHRDLKPSNLFLLGGPVEQVKVLDFGIAQREGRHAAHADRDADRHARLHGARAGAQPGDARRPRRRVRARLRAVPVPRPGRPPFDGDTAAAVLGQDPVRATRRA